MVTEYPKGQLPSYWGTLCTFCTVDLILFHKKINYIWNIEIIKFESFSMDFLYLYGFDNQEVQSIRQFFVKNYGPL